MPSPLPNEPLQPCPRLAHRMQAPDRWTLRPRLPQILLLVGAMACRGAGSTDADTDSPGDPDSDAVETELHTDVDTVDTEAETDADTVDTDTDAVDTDADTVDTDSVTVDTETIDTDSVTVDTDVDTDSDTVETEVDTDSVTTDTETIDTDSVTTDTDTVTVDTETIDTDPVTVDTETIDTDSVTIDTDVDTDSDLVDTDTDPAPVDTDPPDTDSPPADSDTAPGDTALEQAEPPRVCSLPAGAPRVFRPEMLDRFQRNPLFSYIAGDFLWVPGAPSRSTVFGTRGTPTGLAAAAFDLDVLWRDGVDAATTVLLNPAMPGDSRYQYRLAQQLDDDPEVEILMTDWELGTWRASIVETPWTAPPVARTVVTTQRGTYENTLAFGDHDLDGDGTRDLLFLHPGELMYDTAVGRYTLLPPPWPIASVFHGPHTAVRDQLAAETVLWGSAVARSGAVVDLDGDGWQDVVFGFPYEGPGWAGKVMAWRGPLAPGTLTEADADIIIEGRPGEGLGNSMTVLPDSTGDGIPDLVILSQRGGSFGKGAAWMVPTPVTGGIMGIDAIATGRLSSPFERPDRTSVGGTAWVFTAGDLNADGLSDMVISFPAFITHPRGLLSDTGSYGVRDTSDSGDSGDTDVPDTSGWHNGLLVVVPGGLTGEHRLDRGTLRIVDAGAPVPVPDQDGDGYDDLLIYLPNDWSGGYASLLRGCAFSRAP